MDKDSSFFKTQIQPYIKQTNMSSEAQLIVKSIQKVTNMAPPSIKVIRKIVEYGASGCVTPIKVFRRLGYGASGCVYIVQIGERLIVVKIGEIYNIKSLINETKMHIEFDNADMGTPTLLFSYAFKFKKHQEQYIFYQDTYFMIGMTLDEYAISFGMWRKVLEKKQKRATLECMVGMIDSIIERMCKKNLRHGDLHWDNIGFQVLGPQASKKLHTCTIEIDNQTHKVAPLLIDFGYASRGKCFPQLELSQLIRTLHDEYIEIHEYNRKTLRTILVALLKPWVKNNELRSLYHSKIKKWTAKKQNDIENYFTKCRILYMNMK